MRTQSGIATAVVLLLLLLSVFIFQTIRSHSGGDGSASKLAVVPPCHLATADDALSMLAQPIKGVGEGLIRDGTSG
jgi:hypothetical protein